MIVILKSEATLIRFCNKITKQTFTYIPFPGTGADWFNKSAVALGFSGFPIEIKDGIDLSVQVVRHPYSWLREIFNKIPTHRYYSNSILNQVIHYAQLSLTPGELVQRVTEVPGLLTRMFDYAQADTILRVEDFPWAPVELFQSMGGTPEEIGRLPQFDLSVFKDYNEPSDQANRRLVVQAEQDFCERYDYV